MATTTLKIVNNSNLNQFVELICMLTPLFDIGFQYKVIVQL